LWSWHVELGRGKWPLLPLFDEDQRTWAWPDEVTDKRG
jgi:hypothetical protein